MQRPRGIAPPRPVPKRPRLAALAVAAVVLPASLVGMNVALASAPPAFSSFEKERARMMLKIVRDDLERYYYDPAFHDLQLDEAFKQAGDRIDQAGSNGQALAGVARPLLQLNDSHTFFIPPERTARVRLGLRMEMVGDQCYLMAVQPGSDAAAKGLKRGDRVLAFDGHEVTRKNLWGVNYVYLVLAPRPSVTLQIQSPGGAPRQVTVEAEVEERKRILHLATGGDFGDFIREREDEARLRRHRFEEIGDLLIWKMPAFDLSARDVQEDLRKAQKHKALVLDLRADHGGSVESLETLVGAFINNEKLKIGDVKSRAHLDPIEAKHARETFDGTLVVLVDSESASAAELFARTMQLTGRAKVIGDRTSGSVMMSRTYSHMIGDSSGVFFATSVSVADIIMPDGRSLEGAGVTPDEMLLPTAEDLAAGRDPVLSHAAGLCGTTLGPERAGALFPVEWSK